MKRKLLALAAMLLGLGLVWQSAHADGILKKSHHAKPVCEPGYQIVEEIVYQDVLKSVCKPVLEYKKKWVYSMETEPFCIPDTKHGECPNCSGPYCRKLLVKRQVLEACPTLKCEVETIVERVPVVVYKKVPCAIPPTPGTPQAEVIPVRPTPLPPKN